MPTDPRVTRKGQRDVDPDEMSRRYEAGEAGAGSTTIGDEIDSAYEQGRREGASSRSSSSSSSRRTLEVRNPGRPPSIAAPFAIELVLISVDEIRTHHRPPIPSRFIAAFAVFGVLGLASGDAAAAANALGWGLVVATFLAGGPTNKAARAGKSPAVSALGTIGDFIGGKYATKSSGSSTSA